MRLFVGVRPPEAVLDRLDLLARPERPGVRWTRRGEWHVTLRFLGEVDDPAPVAAALDAARLQRCEARLGPRVTTLGRQVVCLPVAGLDDLAGEVREATAALGQPPADRPFRGHLTLARVRDRRARDRGGRGRGERRGRRGSSEGLAGEACEMAFDVAEIHLIRSHLGADGPHYQDLHRVLLGP